MEMKEVSLTDEVLTQLISLSEAWEAENSCYGYRKNSKKFIMKNRIFLAVEDGGIICYLFGHMKVAEDNCLLCSQQPMVSIPAFVEKKNLKHMFEYAIL